jgi:hypothetical protein
MPAGLSPSSRAPGACVHEDVCAWLNAEVSSLGAFVVATQARDRAQRSEPVARWEGEGGRHEPAREDRPDPVLVLAGLVRHSGGAEELGKSVQRIAARHGHCEVPVDRLADAGLGHPLKVECGMVSEWWGYDRLQAWCARWRVSMLPVRADKHGGAVKVATFISVQGAA